jgi:MFS family permease
VRPPADPATTRLTSVVLGFVLVMTMTMGAFQLIAPAVVANDLTDDLAISTALFGAATAVNTIVGALFAPRSGRITDLIGPKRSVVLVMTIAAVGLFLTAAAPNAAVLMLASGLSGFGQGWCNPATNKLIADRVPAGNQGTLTGIKQSGVQLGTFLAGATLPTLAAAFGWRTAIGVYGVAALLAAAVAQLYLGPDATTDATGGRTTADVDSPLPRSMWLLTGYALLMGCVVGGVGRFLPLFAEDQLGMSNFQAGMVSALIGGLAIGTRILWAQLTERVLPASRGLTIQAALSVASMALLLVAVPLGGWVLWVMAVVGALGLNAWNSVAMLAIITGVPPSLAGRASGVVVFGFMAGLSGGGFYTGVVETRTGRFDLAWWTFLVLAGCATVLASINRSLGERPTALGVDDHG